MVDEVRKVIVKETSCGGYIKVSHLMAMAYHCQGLGKCPLAQVFSAWVSSSGAKSATLTKEREYTLLFWDFFVFGALDLLFLLYGVHYGWGLL